jgi:hypothetical protein
MNRYLLRKVGGACQGTIIGYSYVTRTCEIRHPDGTVTFNVPLKDLEFVGEEHAEGRDGEVGQP